MILSGRLATSGHAKLCREMAQTGFSPRRMDDALYMPGACDPPRSYCHHLLKRLIITWIWLANQRVYMLVH